MTAMTAPPTCRPRAVSACAAFLLACASPAAAGPVIDAVFPLAQGACWGRSYDAAHLAAHPAQKVKTLHLWDHWGKNGLYETPDDRDYADPDGKPDTAFPTILVERADRPGVWSRSITCTEKDGRLGCVADEDDGVHFPLVLAPKDGALLADLVEPGLPLIRAPDLERLGRPPQEAQLRPGTDDRRFRLERRPVAECRDRLRATAPDYARTDAAPVRALALAGLARSTANPEGQFRMDAGRICLKAAGSATPTLAAFNPARGDYPVGIDGFVLKVQRGDGAKAKRWIFQCGVRAWEWRCAGAVAGPDGSRIGDDLPLHLIRRKGGVALVAASALWSGGDEKALDPPLAMTEVDVAVCPPAMWKD